MAEAETETKTVPVEIKNRWTNEVIFSAQVDVSIGERWRLRAAVEMAVKQRANLSAANLSNANLSDANLRDANLRNANLRNADLSAADLSDADLSAADLRNANLSAANLSAADLSNANLSDDANLRNANLRNANLSDANLRNANLSDANLSDAYGITLPSPEESDRRIRAVAKAALATDASLHMSYWHHCETSHCIAGWAVHNEGPVGYLLEKAVGAPMAGLMLLGVEAHSHFYDDNATARKWLQSKLDAPQPEAEKVP